MTYSPWPVITVMMIVVLYVDYFGTISITFSGVVATNKLWRTTNCKLSSYISNNNTPLMLWLTSFVTAYNNGSHITPSPALVGPHPLNQFIDLFLATLLLNPRLDETNSFVAILLNSGKMLSNCIIRTADLAPSSHLTNGCTLLLMLFRPSLLHYGASATTNYMDTMDNSPLKQNAKSL
jgi:hypothetical protein